MTRDEARKKAIQITELMTLPEKASQLLQRSPAIPRLGIEFYDWWNEALHGVARADIATVFPQAIGLAATFDTLLINRVACAISDEARAKYNEYIKCGDRSIYKGLTFWSPNINIFRDPRWGRGQETYGEDPFLTSEMGVAFVKGLQGDGEFIKAAACAKHYAVHSGPESLRHSFDASCSEKDLRETYLPAFERLVKDAKVEGVMGAYNRINGEPSCAHTHLMDEILFTEWSFEGYYVSDCGAICDFHNGHHITENGPQSAALAIKHGCNINCGNAYENILAAVEQGLISEQEVEYNVINAYTTRFMLGEFEETHPYSDIPFDVVDSRENVQLNIETAKKSLVLLKNNGILPLCRDEIKSIALIGPNAQSEKALYGNYHGTASEYVTVADGLRRAAPGVRINYATGSDISGNSVDKLSGAVIAAKKSDAAVVCLGLNENFEGEEMNIDSDYFDRGDRKKVSLPTCQLELLEKVCEATNRVIVVIMAGSSVDIGELREKVAAEIYAWYPGAQGGAAIAQLLFGNYSPSGRLPVTVYSKDECLPDFRDYSMANRTYRYFNGKPVYPFGFGLSYTHFEYENAAISGKNEEYITLLINVRNTGACDANEITQVYAKFTDSRTATPNYQLCALKSTYIKSGDTARISLGISRYWIKAVDEAGERIEPNGEISLFIGSHQPDAVSSELAGSECIELRIK